ncbi:MAG TPA: glycerol-3-phosphate dehydrogenase [Steroidobacteraceae bacterium]|nr:glycerol-3-phosphate dehydrogenase [Steroidobacteraceae bacterium]
MTESALPGEIDVLIVGGGINGAGIARDAAGRGLTVCLIEQSDLAAFTSSASTKLIHGGLRYLEYGEVRLVREALIERERLLTIAPHLVHPLRFVLPHVPELRPRWEIRLGLLLYDHLGGRRNLAPSRALRLDRDPAGAALRSQFVHGCMYSDCRVDDSRLVVLNALDAAERGALILPRTRLLRAVPERGAWLVECVDTASGARSSLRARVIVNAAGGWVDPVRRSIGLAPELGVRLVKGSHIVVPSLFEGTAAYLLQNEDRRVVFAIPYEEHLTLIGTTDVPFEGQLESVTVSSAEVDYLCESVNRYFRRTVSPSDVLWRYAGVRALKDDQAQDASAVTRDYELHVEESSGGSLALTVIGGKLSTYRSLADSALEALQARIGGSRRRWTHEAPLPGGDVPDGDFQAFEREALRRWGGLPHRMVTRMARAYGTRIERILGASGAPLEALGERFGADLTAAEIDYLQDSEWAASAADILWRRSKLGLAVPSDAPARIDRYLTARARRSPPSGAPTPGGRARPPA